MIKLFRMPKIRLGGLLFLGGLLACSDIEQTDKSESETQEPSSVVQSTKYIGKRVQKDEADAFTKQAPLPRLSQSDVFLNLYNNSPIYFDQGLTDPICYLEQGDQLLIRAETEESYKVRLDQYLINKRACASDAEFAYISKDLLVPSAPALTNSVRIALDDTKAFDFNDSQREVCKLRADSLVTVLARKGSSYTKIRIDDSDSCDNGFVGEAILNKLEGLPINEAFHRLGKLTPYTLAKDLLLYTNDSHLEELCTLAKGNVVLVETNKSFIQMPKTPHCSPDEVSKGHYIAKPGLWEEYYPR